MYLNFNTFHKHNLQPEDLYFLAAIKQIEKEQLKNIPIEVIQRFESLGILTTIKGAKSEAESLKIRLNRKGRELFEELSIPGVTEGDLKMMDYLVQMYLNNEDSERTIGNKKKITQYITIMRNHLGLSLHQFYYLCEYFLAEYPYTKVLEYIFFNSNKNRYGKFHNNIEDSPLYQFYDNKKQEVEFYWNQKLR
jgi:hypothetical protein